MKHNRIAAFPTVLTLALTALATQGTAHAQPRVAPAALNPSVNPSVVTQFQASPDMDEVKEQRLIRVSKATALAPTEPKALEPGSAVAGGDILLDLDFISVNMPPDGDGPTEIAFSADGSTFVISHRDSQNLVVFDAETRNVAQTIPLSGSPNSLALTADGVYAVTANLYEDTASIVDLTLGAEVAVVAVGDQPGVVRITPDDSLAVVGNTIDGDLSILNIASAIETKRLPAAGFVQSLSFGAFGFDVDFTDYKITPGNTVIFPARFDDQILFIDIDSGATTAVDSEPDPRMIDLSSDGKTAVVSHSSSESHVSVIDTVTQTIFKSIPVGGSSGISPRIAINNEKTKAVVSSLNHVRVVDLENETVSEDLHTGAVEALLTNFDGDYCAIGNYQSSLLDFTTDALITGLVSTTTPDELAVSPVGPRSATAHSILKEHTETINIDGEMGFLEGEVPTGPQPEGDRARGVAISRDGSLAVVINNHSRNATIMDLENGVVEGVVPVGLRPGGVAITPDGSTAVVANLDSSFASVIDLATATATHVDISRRGSQVAISPDGQYAYIPVVADGDGVWRIHLQTLSVEGPRILTGNMGGITFSFDWSSGMTLSPDGSTLVTCGSFSNNVSIIDTTTWTEIDRVQVGNFPTRAVFARDSETLYVSNRDGNSVSIVSKIDDQWSLVDTVPVGDAPIKLALNPTGTELYVGNYSGGTVSIVDTASRSLVGTVVLPQGDSIAIPTGLDVSTDAKRLYVATSNGDFHVIDTAAQNIATTLNTSATPVDLVFNHSTACGHMPSPFGQDGLSIVCVSAEGQIFVDGFESGDVSAWTLEE